jgi:hypothetical protein
MRFGTFEFGSIQIDGVTHDYDVVIDRGSVRKRKKKQSKPFRDAYGHTPLSAAEEIPWKCRRLVIGTGVRGALPIMEDVERGLAGARSNSSCFRPRRRSTRWERGTPRPTLYCM